MARICADGFADDPVMSWVFQDPATSERGRLIAFTGLSRSYLVPNSVLQVIDDGCATLWRAPAWAAPAATEDDMTPDDREPPWGPDVTERFRIVGEAMEAAHPHDRPHWYLNVIATLASRRGHGLGARALRSVLDRADAAGEPAYLESSNPRNMTLYRRHGFDDVGDPIDLPDGPSLYPMWREPR